MSISPMFYVFYCKAAMITRGLNIKGVIAQRVILDHEIVEMHYANETVCFHNNMQQRRSANNSSHRMKQNDILQ